jgi:hypothetical protein
MKALTLEYPLSSAASVTDLPSESSRVEQAGLLAPHSEERTLGSWATRLARRGFPVFKAATAVKPWDVRLGMYPL